MNHRFDDDEVSPEIRGISQGRCTELLQSHSVGRIAWQGAGVPEILPVNYIWYDDSVVFRTSPDGALAGLVEPTEVAFEIDELDLQRREGWSVLVHGRTHGLGKTEQLAQLMAGADVLPWAAGQRNVYVQIKPTKVTGRTVAARPR
jgi:nitroimidazol reductase NimA-like FMN-containing flavoprotein (pyridoxamine 5'-phosphate oxidase superfamily)